MATKTDLENLRVPPQNIDAERSVLGSLMLDKDAVIKIANLIRLGDFYKDIHNLIYEAMMELYEQREPIDVLSLSNRLEEKNQLEKIGGSSYLASLASTVPSSSNIVHYAKVFQKKPRSEN
ncbi:MAG: DnaB-like helicase N-terminal domain-containing protein [Parcubacteria group bacterium]|jgi:replicative DNA helicase